MIKRRSGGKRARSSKYGLKNQYRLMRQIANRAVNKNIETKVSVYTRDDGVEISHNNFITLDNNVLQTTNGPNDPRTANTANRIGDTINLRGVSMKMMVELNERYSDVTFRLLVVKAARGDTPTRATLFNGLSGNKMIDTLNTERYTILASKVFKMTAPNTGNIYASGAGGIPQPSGYADNLQSSQSFSRATRIVKLWIPGNKFTKSGKIIYEDGSATPKFFDYHVLLYAYSNYTTLQDAWNVGRLNDYIKVMYFKDA